MQEQPLLTGVLNLMSSNLVGSPDHFFAVSKLLNREFEFISDVRNGAGFCPTSSINRIALNTIQMERVQDLENRCVSLLENYKAEHNVDFDSKGAFDHFKETYKRLVDKSFLSVVAA